jgi:hypothetical protein
VLHRNPEPHPAVLFTSISPPGGRISGTGRWFIQTGVGDGLDFTFVNVMCYVRKIKFRTTVQ